MARIRGDLTSVRGIRRDCRPSRRRSAYRGSSALMVIALVAVSVAAGVLVVRSQQNRRADIIGRFAARHSTSARFIEAYLQQNVEHLGELASATMSGPVSRPRFDDIALQNRFSAATLLDAGGRELAVSPAASTSANPIGTRVDQSDPILTQALAGKASVSTILVPDRTGPLVQFAVPFQTSRGRRVFVAGISAADTPLGPFIDNALSAFPGAHVYLVDPAGVVIESDADQSVGASLPQVSAPLSTAVRHRAWGAYREGDQRLHYFSGSIQGTPWRLVFTIDDRELYRLYTPGQRRAPWLELLGFVVMALGILALFDRAQAGRARAEDDHAQQQAILDTASDAFIGMDHHGLVIDWNTAAARLLGWTKDEALGQPVANLMVPPGNRPAHSDGLRAFLRTEVPRLPQHPITVTAQHRDGHEIPIELTVSRSQWQGSWRFHAFMRDITERLEHERQLQAMALTDALTGLANRRAFLTNLDQAHARARRHHTRLAVLYADVDQFKSINDTFGHAAGDSILTQISERLRGHFRTEDTIGRLGGDEFAIVCEDFAAYDESLVERLRMVLAVPYSFRGQPILATVSVGMASPEDDETTEHLLERADGVMYLAKAGGGRPDQSSQSGR